MAHYVDGFVTPVPLSKKKEYLKMARRVAKVWLDYGALEVRECWADDVQPGKVTSFPQAVKLKPGEAVVFSWVVYPSKKVRDKANKEMMKDPRLADMMDPKAMPFDGKRMFWGGFRTILEA